MGFNKGHSPEALKTLVKGEIAALATGSEQERFRLFNACNHMNLVVEHLNDDAAAIGLTEDALQTAAESRLRAARLYTDDSKRALWSYLYVRVTVSGLAFSLSVKYNKMMTDDFGRAGSVPTWETGSAGRHGRDAGYIVSALSQHLDKFLAAYLRVNEAACNSALARP